MALPYYTLGGSGLRVTQLALGTMTFGTGSGFSVDEATSRALFDRYLEAGGNLFDTADVYTSGLSETLLGKFVNDAGVRDQVVLATKFTHNFKMGNPNSVGNGRKNIIRAVEASLQRMQTDYIDLYQMHLWDQLTPPEEVLRALDDLVRSGKVRYIGLSDIPAWYASRMQTVAELRGLEPLCALQMEYSLLERNIEHEFIRLGTDYGMGVLVWSPLASGLLSGKYDEAGIQGRLGTKAGGMLDKRAQEGERVTAVISTLRSVAQALGRSMPQVAINWVANRPGVGAVILGATKVAQLDDTLQALDFSIPAELRQQLDDVSMPTAHHPYNVINGPVANAGAAAMCNVGDKPESYRPPVAFNRKPQ